VRVDDSMFISSHLMSGSRIMSCFSLPFVLFAFSRQSKFKLSHKVELYTKTLFFDEGSSLHQAF
jgi:hypothetical protein